MKKSLIVAGGMICLLAVNVLLADDDEKSIVSKPIVTLSGTDSQVSERGYQRILSMDDWALVWQKHKGQTSDVGYDYYYDPLGLPVIDFDHFMVIAVFEDRRAGAGLMVESILEDDDSITIRFTKKTFSTAKSVVIEGGVIEGGVGEDSTIDLQRRVFDRLKTQDREKVNVFGFFVIPRSGKSVILEEAVYRTKPESIADASKTGFGGFGKSKSTRTREWEQCFKFDEIQEKK